MNKRIIAYLISAVFFMSFAKPVYSVDVIAYIKYLTRNVYPELNRRDLSISFENIIFSMANDGFPKDVIVKVGEEKIMHTDTGHDKYPGIINPAFVGSFSFSRDGILDRMFSEGTILGTRQRICKEIANSEQKWTDQEIVEYIKAKGAKYGPLDKEALLKTIPIQRLQLIMGKIKVLQTDFDVREKSVEEEPVSLKWRVLMKIKTKRGWMRYLFSFEPFEGKLLSIGCLELPDKIYNLHLPTKPK